MSRKGWVLVGAGFVLALVAAITLLPPSYDGPPVMTLSTSLDTELLVYLINRAKPGCQPDETFEELAAEVGLSLPVSGLWPGVPGNPPLDPSVDALAGRSVARALELVAEGDAVRAVDLLAAAWLCGEDLFGRAGFDAIHSPLVDRAERALGSLTADQALSGPALERAIAFLSESLQLTPPPREAFRFRVLAEQSTLRALLSGELKSIPPTVDWGGPVPRRFGWGWREVHRDDYLLAWHRLRLAFAPLFVPEGEPSEEELHRIAAQIRDEYAGRSDSLPGRIISRTLIYGQLARDGYEDQLRRREALLFGLLMLRHREQTGAFPTDLETIRVPEIPASPHGGAWRLGIDRETRQAAVFLDGGRIHSYQVLAPDPEAFHGDVEGEPLFSFR